MYLAAISTGYAVPEGDFDALVHSAFRSALNLRRNGGDELLTLIAAGQGDLPQGIRLETPEGFSFEGIQTGGRATCRDGILRFENGSLTVQLNGAGRWKCDLPALTFDPAVPAVAAAWKFVWTMLNRRQRLIEAEIVAEDLFRMVEPSRKGISRRVGESMRGLIKAARNCELTDPSPVASLIGLGTGLTPGGDDLLVGFLAGLWCTIRGSAERMRFLASLGSTIIQLSHETNDISRTYLYHAAQGQVARRLAIPAESICSGQDPAHLTEPAEAALRVGHTSGLEAVTGLLAGLAAWEGNQLLPELE